jgi:hypothetical protein
VPANTATPTPGACLTFGQKVSLVIGILRRLGSQVGDARYQARYDINEDGIIDALDAFEVLATPTCWRGDGGDD